MDWSSPIPTQPENANLVAALWTSYRPVSPEFLAGDVLPQLVGIVRRENEDMESREWFIAEAMQALAPLKGKLTVITSPPISIANSQTDAWLWHYVTPFTVGNNGPCTQHAKLWLFHWESKNLEQSGKSFRDNAKEFLQITVSSTNLTPDAFKNQIQGGWSITLPIKRTGPKPTENTLDTLVKFLSDLGTAAKCMERVDYWNSLIDRTLPPENIKFIASIPGKPSPLTQWPIQKTSKLWILTPFIGQWDSYSLDVWKKAICKKEATINLLWPDKSHRWVGKIDNEGEANWQIPGKSVAALLGQDECLRKLPEMPVFNGGNENDKRWGHLKLYKLDNGLLVGSHNWSLSAWGLPKGNRYPKNFELSVFIPDALMPCDLRLNKLRLKDIRICQEEPQNPERHWLSWAQAQWNGDFLQIEWKATEPVTVAWHDGTQWQHVKAMNTNILSVPISDTDKAPRLVKFAIINSIDDEVSIAVADIRSGDDLPVGVSSSIAEKADLILLEKYGGPQAESANYQARKKTGADNESADYRTQWLISSRRWSRVVDKWREIFNENTDCRGCPSAIRLANALQRLSENAEIGGIGARIAAEELRLLGGVIDDRF